MEESTSETRSHRRLRRRPSANVIKLIGASIIALILTIGGYWFGYSRGESHQKKYDLAHRPAPISTPNSASARNRWTLIGNVESVDGQTLKLKTTHGDEREIKLTKETVYTDRTAKKVDIKSLKKDVKVIASGSKDDKGVYTATRVRIEQ